MSAVVLRCPNCGTTQLAAGECDACHEADVRYWCANHTPGRWLDGPACATVARPSSTRTPDRARTTRLTLFADLMGISSTCGAAGCTTGRGPTVGGPGPRTRPTGAID